MVQRGVKSSEDAFVRGREADYRVCGKINRAHQKKSCTSSHAFKKAWAGVKDKFSNRRSSTNG